MFRRLLTWLSFENIFLIGVVLVKSFGTFFGVFAIFEKQHPCISVPFISERLYSRQNNAAGLGTGLKKQITTIDFKTICILCSRQEAKMQWGSRGDPRSWRYSTRWETALFSTRTAHRGWSGEKEFTKECLITLSRELSLASSGLQLLPQAVLQPDRRNFYGQSHRTAPRLDLERQSDGVDTLDFVHGRCKHLYEFFSVLHKYGISRLFPNEAGTFHLPPSFFTGVWRETNNPALRCFWKKKNFACKQRTVT